MRRIGCLGRTLGWLFVAGILYGAFTFVLDRAFNASARRQLAVRQDELARLQQQARVLEAAVRRRAEFEQAIQERERELRALEPNLPPELSVEALRSELAALGSASGVQVEQVSLGEEEASEFYATVAVEVAARGSYADLLRFADRLRGQPRPLRLDAFDLRRGGGGVFVATLRLSAFRFVDAG